MDYHTQPKCYSRFNSLIAVTAVSSNDVWAVGSADTSNRGALIEHWDAQQWSIVPGPPHTPGGSYDLSAVSAVSLSDVWAVGAETNVFTHIEHYTAQCPPSPTPTSRPPHALLSSPIVLPGSTFYPYVHCMACLGIIHGYPSGCETGDPCFRPGNPITRGQLSKIVSNSAGFYDPPSAQLFEDVPQARPSTTTSSAWPRVGISAVTRVEGTANRAVLPVCPTSVRAGLLPGGR